MAPDTHNKQLKDKIKHLLLKYGALPLIFMTGKALPSCSPESKDAPRPRTEIQNKIPAPQVAQATTDITFATDTLETPSLALMYYAPPSIIRNFVPDNSKYALHLSTLVHENKHKDNYNQKMSLRPLTPMQYACMRIDDEISASICELLTLRFEYLAAQSPEEKQKIVKFASQRRFNYYFDAVEAGKIHPEKTDSLNREQEWKFIAQETEKMWMENSWPVYRPGITRMVERYLGRIPANLSQKQTDKNYRRARQIAYNIGGVNFLQYLPERNSVPDKTLKMMDGIGQMDIFAANKKEYMQRINITINKLKHQNQILSPELITHVCTAEGLKLALKGIDREVLLKHPNIVAACYHNINKKLSSSAENSGLPLTILHKESLNGPYLPEATSPELTSQLYTHKNVDLYALIADFRSAAFANPLLNIEQYTSPDEVFLQFELNNLRKRSSEEATSPAPPPAGNKTKPRRSEKMNVKAPDFSQPILTSASPEQMAEIYSSIREFNKIPQVMRECNIEAQKAYLKNQQQSSK